MKINGVSIHSPFENRSGQFGITLETVHALGWRLLPIMGQFFISRVEFLFDQPRLAYGAASSMFDPVPDGEKWPWYGIIAFEQGDGHFLIRAHRQTPDCRWAGLTYVPANIPGQLHGLREITESPVITERPVERMWHWPGLQEAPHGPEQLAEQMSQTWRDRPPLL